MKSADLTPEQCTELLVDVLLPIVFGPPLRFIPEFIVAPRPVISGVIWFRRHRSMTPAAAGPLGRCLQ
jgi:hypothetical protein